MIQLGGIIIDFGCGDEWSIILTAFDLMFLYISWILCLILHHIKKIEGKL